MHIHMTYTTIPYIIHVHIPAGRRGVGYVFPPFPLSAPPIDPLLPLDEAEREILISYKDILVNQTAFKRGKGYGYGMGMSGLGMDMGTHNSTSEGDVINLCVASGWHLPPTRRKLSMLVEFIQHHVSMGIHHIYLPIHQPIHSKTLRYVAYMLRTYIHKQQVTVWSTVGYEVSVDGMGDGYGKGEGMGDDIHLTYQDHYTISLSMCAILTHTHTQNHTHTPYMAVWDAHQFFVPRNSNNNIAQSIQSDGYGIGDGYGYGHGVGVIPAAEMSVVDYAENFLVGTRNPPFVWLGDIYVRSPTHTLDRESDGYVWRRYTHTHTESHIRTSSPSLMEVLDSMVGFVQDILQVRYGMDTNSTDMGMVGDGKVYRRHTHNISATLYDFFFVDEHHLHCSNGVHTPSHTTPITAHSPSHTHIQNTYTRQASSVCGWYDPTHRMHMIHTHTPAHTQSLYHTHYFGVVYGEMLKKNVDLFFDGITLYAPENAEGFIFGDKDYIPYFDVYLANPHRKMRVLNFTVY
ncbi:hypothetical protein EON63_13805 [archaeon]|nr:MAG: hypothetical protein EON63_13805 [archaeon]